MCRKLRGAVPLLGGAGSPSNTMWPGMRPTAMPGFILIHPTVWPQYTNGTDRQDRTESTDKTGQRSNSLGRTVLQTVAPKLKPHLFALYDTRPGKKKVGRRLIRPSDETDV